MTNLLNYLIESGATLAVFYLFYLLILKNQANFKVNRSYLLGAVIFALALPFINIPIEQTPSVNSYSEIFLSPVTIDANAAENTDGLLNLQNIGWAVYAFGLLTFAGAFLLQHRQLHKLIKSGKAKNYKGYELVCTESTLAPFSFFNRIVVHNKDFSDPARLEMIIQHEMIHIRKFHSIDNYIITLMGIIHWFNPFLWLFKRELRNVHEFEADQETVEKTGNPGFYKNLLFTQAMRVDSLSLVNNFNSSIKNRLLMLQKKSSVSGMLRGLIFVPLTVAMLFVFACNEEDEGDSNKINQSGKEINESESKTNKKETSSDKENENENEKTFVRVENMPEFQGGGINKFRNYIQKNLEYP
ncbi:MAG: M56 family metallopeptidase, partial [Bacteroidota bacterium]